MTIDNSGSQNEDAISVNNTNAKMNFYELINNNTIQLKLILNLNQ